MTAESYLLAIFANRDTGEPDRGDGRIGHVVRVGPNPDMPVVQEFSDGGIFEHEDCAPASMYSRCLEGGVNATVRELETLAGTNLNGTGFPGCVRALNRLGIAAALATSAPAGYIMNPMLPAIVPVSEFPRYLAASQGGDCFVSMAGSVPKPTPVPTPVEEDDMPKLGQFIAKTTTGQLAYFISDGMQFRHVLNPTDEAGVLATGPWFNGDGQPLRLWNPNPVADISAFGVPANKETADLLGITFP